jgi:ribosomal protein S18 acetylase RimI-like enzyme
VTIRPATVDDVAEVAAVQVASWRSAYAGLLPADFLAGLDVTARAEQWRQNLTTAEGTVLLAQQSGRIVGFVAVGPAEDDPTVGTLYAIYVDPSHWGDGVGHALHDAGLQILRDLGCGSVRLWVLRGNDRATAFYVRHGWTRDGRERVEDYLGIELPVIGFSREL